MLRKIILALGVLLIVGVVAVGSYTQLYRPAHRPILDGERLPIRPGLSMRVTPLAQLPEPTRVHISNVLRETAIAANPGYHITGESMYIFQGGWDPVRTMTGEYLGRQFGFEEQIRSELPRNNGTFDYLMWSASGVRRLFDDRLVVALQYFDPEAHDTPLGYFVMRPN